MILVLDCETTGLIEPIEAIEVAYIEIDFPTLVQVGLPYVERFLPSKPIEFGALATSHILLSELDKCKPSGSFVLPKATEYIIGHNIDYDWRVIGSPDVKRICTKALSTYLRPEVDSKSQSAMMYFYLGDKAKPLLKEAHNALDDVRNCFTLLKHLTGDIYSQEIEDYGTSIEGLWELSEIARIPTIMPFGKHKGELISTIPRDYRNWLLRQPDVDPYLITALKVK